MKDGLAVRTLREVPRPLALASALEDLGRTRLAEGATADAVDAFDQALALSSAHGAAWDAARVRSRLRRLGVRRRLVAPTGGSDLPIALLEDVIAVGCGFLFAYLASLVGPV